MYNNVVMGPRSEFIRSESPSDDEARRAERRYLFEWAWAAICPPLLGAVTWVLMLAWLEDVDGVRSLPSYSQALMPLMITGFMVLAAVILLDLRAIEKLPALVAADLRWVFCGSAMVSLLFVAVWITARAVREQPPYGDEMLMFVYLPTLLVCAPLLWFSARAIRRIRHRALVLAGFVSVTTWVELQCHAGSRGDLEERVLMFNSLIVALAVALRLCVWGATEFRNP